MPKGIGNELKYMEEQLLKQGNGARGVILGDWKGFKGGHYFNYEVKDGEVIYVDAQVNEDGKSNLAKMDLGTLWFARVDNLKIKKSMVECVKKR